MTRVVRVIRVPLYTLVVGVAVGLGSPVLSLFAAVSIANNNAAHQLRAQRDSEAAAKQKARKVTCAFFASSLDVYKENPPISPAGKAQAQNYVELYRVSGCQPPRTK